MSLSVLFPILIFLIVTSLRCEAFDSVLILSKKEKLRTLLLLPLHSQSYRKMSATIAPELLESIYSCFIKSGFKESAKSLAKVAKLDEKKLKKSTPADLMQLYTSSLK
jgi:hypothetical protein